MRIPTKVLDMNLLRRRGVELLGHIPSLEIAISALEPDQTLVVGADLMTRPKVMVFEHGDETDVLLVEEYDQLIKLQGVRKWKLPETAISEVFPEFAGMPA